MSARAVGHAKPLRRDLGRMRPGGFSPPQTDRSGRPDERGFLPSFAASAGDMALDLSKNGAELMAAYKDVVDGRSDVNWLLLTYEGDGRTVRLAGKGGGGLEEMVEELNSGKVMYAFCRVQDPDSGLPKYVLVNWTGEGVKETHKGLCANHLGALSNFLKGAHVTINARDEDDVEPGLILSKVSKASGAGYNFARPAGPRPGDLPRGTVGSVYRKTNAVEEIQQVNKDSFWSQEQREEELWRREEAAKVQLQRRALEQERLDSEDKRARERDRQVQERNSAIDRNRLLQKQREAEEREEEQRRRKLEEREPASPGVRRAASAQAASEAEALVSRRSFDPRQIFRQKEAAWGGDAGDAGGAGDAASAPRVGKLRSPFLSFEQPAAHKAFSAWERETSPSPARPAGPPAQSAPPSWSATSSPVPGPTSADDFLSPVAAPAQAAAEEDDWSDDFDEDLYEAAPSDRRLESLADAMFGARDQHAAPRPAGGPLEDAGTAQERHAERAAGQNVCARAVYDYQAADDTEITFDPGDVIADIDMVDEGWWRGCGPDGHYGMFPANYVELL